MTSELFSTLARLCAEISASGKVSIQFASDDRQCHLRNDRVSLFVTFSDPYYSDFALTIREYDKRMGFGDETLFYPDDQPKVVSESKFLPDMNRAREYGWIEKGQPSNFITSDVLANTITIRFVDLVEKAGRGDFRISQHARPIRRR